MEKNPIQPTELHDVVRHFLDVARGGHSDLEELLAYLLVVRWHNDPLQCPERVVREVAAFVHDPEHTEAVLAVDQHELCHLGHGFHPLALRQGGLAFKQKKRCTLRLCRTF